MMIYLFRLVFVFSVFICWSSEKTVALNMIVKNEGENLRECLESVKDWIDYWVIVDVGSTDNTREIVREVLKDIPGELLESTWVSFESNLNEALESARFKANYLLIINADEVLSSSESINKPLLDKDCYFISVEESGIKYQRVLLIDTSLPWKWEGEVSASLICSSARTFDVLEGSSLLTYKDIRGSSQNNQKDTKILEEAFRQNPTSTRHAFYLAQSYLNGEQKELALELYLKRADMGGDANEVFWSLYMAACLQENLNKDSEKFIETYEKAYEYNSSRAEPLYRLARYYLSQQHTSLAYDLAKRGVTIPLPQKYLYVEPWIYSYGFELILANCAFEMGRYAEAEHLCRDILSRQDLPVEIQASVESNLHLLSSIK